MCARERQEHGTLRECVQMMGIKLDLYLPINNSLIRTT